MSSLRHDAAMPHVTRAYVALGSNIGDRLALLQHGLEMIAVLAAAPDAGSLPADAALASGASSMLPSSNLRASGVYETSPVGGPGGQPAFLNAVVEVSTLLHAEELLARLMLIERQSGRVRGVLEGPRSLDLDLLLFGDQWIEKPRLHVPHPRLHQRRFVLEPLSELAPDLVHPRLHRTIGHLRAAAEREYPDQRVERLTVALRAGHRLSSR
ncbi:MAG: 2-amino-4-hydroxy-6-hydroxymethyldihydropteridine diphosphokinase [Phycisphaerales bacterium]|nr:2-amino-4-hydroxy-6-hydroxymethyldihydropteridine diphosphokinase [Phycisphaerales bacterium]